jgi:cysteine-rich repeat protein
MKRYLFSLFALCLFGCQTPPTEPTPPFIHVTVVPPAVGVPPVASDFTILVEAIVEGNLIQKVIETPTGDLPLPLDFVILFSEEIRGQAIDISVTGFADGVDVFSGVTSGIANADDIILVAGFCGDTEINGARNETCDDGPDNSDTAPGACRLSCLLAGCGDGIVDPGEDCDDANNNSDTTPNACRTDCQAAFCGDGVADTGEACDDGANNSDLATDACRTDCQAAFCGDGVIDTGEDCDDANNTLDDGCDPGCVTTVVQVSAGNAHTCLLTRSGKVKCWGSGAFGQLGYGNTNDIGDNETPASVGFVDVGGVVKQISAEKSHTCAVLINGDVRCWGLNNNGQLGYGNTNNIGDNETPASAGNVNVGGAVLQVAAGGLHTCALLSTNNVRCWGQGSFGALGHGNQNSIGDNETPSSAGNVDVGGSVSQIVAGDFHTCALLTTKKVRCWGDGNLGQLGYGNTNDIGDDETPASVGDVNIGGFVVQVTINNSHSCVLLDTGKVRCWGGAGARLGYGNVGNIGDNETPASAGDVNVGGIVTQVTAGGGYTCGLLTTGKVRCWGGSFDGQLGYGDTNTIGDNETPASAGDVNVGDLVTQLVTGNNHTCVVLLTGGVRCWGLGTFGRLGYGDIASIGDDEVPADVGDVPLF